MRLLNTHTLEFEDFFDSNTPKYVILSHRWEGKEMTYQEFQESGRQNHPGFSKIHSVCFLAQQRRCDWVWIDTCCIDKKSSAELSEAINSMYRWYELAQECYAYLSDVSISGYSDQDLESTKLSLRKSAWFTRGWTLQELLAPRLLNFYDRKWKFIGNKRDPALELSSITGIETRYLGDYSADLNPPQSASIAQRMSWVSKRKTSRIEDIAYCMLGIFDVNMPLLYGEGSKAFMRLQLEIIKKSDDESIFAWTAKWFLPGSYRGMLAPSHEHFLDSQDVRYEPRVELLERRPFAMTNKGLEIQLPKRLFDQYAKTVTLILNCYKTKSDSGPWVVINLRKIGRGWGRVDLGEHLLSRKPVELDVRYNDPTLFQDTFAIYVGQAGT